MPEICGKNTPHILLNYAHFPAYFALKSFAYFKKILRNKQASLIVVALRYNKYFFFPQFVARSVINCANIIQLTCA